MVDDTGPLKPIAYLQPRNAPFFFAVCQVSRSILLDVFRRSVTADLKNNAAAADDRSTYVNERPTHRCENAAFAIIFGIAALPMTIRH